MNVFLSLMTNALLLMWKIWYMVLYSQKAYYYAEWIFCVYTVARIALVKPEKARGVEDVILRAAQMGQIAEKVIILNTCYNIFLDAWFIHGEYRVEVEKWAGCIAGQNRPGWVYPFCQKVQIVCQIWVRQSDYSNTNNLKFQ